MNKSRRLEQFMLGIFLVLLVFSVAVQSTMAKVGNGTLYVYTDSSYATLAPQDPTGPFLVAAGQTIYIQIAGITEKEFSIGASIFVKIYWDPHVKTWTRTVKTLDSGQTTARGVGDSTDPIIWTVGEFDDGNFEIPIFQTLTVHYKDTLGRRPEYDAAGTISKIGSLLVIPETPLGSVGPLIIFLVGLGIFVLNRKNTSLKNRARTS